MAAIYGLLGRRVVVHLYTRDGVVLGTVAGRVADVAEAVEVAPGMKKDLAYVIDIETGDVPYRNSTGRENEGWFAVQDLELIERGDVRWFAN